MGGYGYYKSETRSSKHDKKSGAAGGILLAILDIVALVVTVAAAAALFLALFAKWISPENAALFAFLGLFYPIIYIVNVACALWWTVRWRKWFFVSLVVLFLGFWNMKLFYRPDWNKEYGQRTINSNEIGVMTYNVMNFSGKNIDAEITCRDAIIGFINARSPQIVCLQEAYFSSLFDISELEKALSKINYSHCSSSAVNGGEHGSGLAILSTYPIVRSGRLHIDSTAVRSIWADLKINRDTVRVVCNHLQSTAIDSEDMHTTLTPQIIEDTLAREKLMVVARKMTGNYRLRAQQAEGLASFIAESPYRTIVCGDFNDTPMSYAYTKISKRLTDAYVACGHGTGSTFKGFWNMFRIDFALFSEGLAVKDYSSFDVEMSDHKPVVVHFEIEHDIPSLN